MTDQDLNGQKTAGKEHGWPRDSWEALEMLVDGISRSFAGIVVIVVNVVFNAIWIALLFWSFGMLPSGLRNWLLGLAGLG
jgi:hypothetical protein